MSQDTRYSKRSSMTLHLRKSLPFMAIAGILLSVLHASKGQESAEDTSALMSPRQLIEAVESADRLERGAIVEALIDNRKEALPALRAALRDGTATERVFACRLLSKMRDTVAIGHLIELTHTDDISLLLNAINALRNIGATEAAPRLREILVMDSLRPNISVCTLGALGDLGDENDAQEIRRYLSDSSHAVVTAAAGALAMLGCLDSEDVLIEMTGSDNPLAQKLATKSLGLLDTPGATQRLHSIIDNPSANWRDYARIAIQQQRLRKIRSMFERIRLLSKLTSDGNRLMAEWAVWELSDIGTREAWDEVVALSSGNSRHAPMALRLCKFRGELPR